MVCCCSCCLRNGFWEMDLGCIFVFLSQIRISGTVNYGNEEIMVD